MQSDKITESSNNVQSNNDQIIGFHLPNEPYGCFSNWYPAKFELAGHHYENSEQYMMYRKVMLAKKYDLADMVMATPDPAMAKQYAGPKYFTDFPKIEYIWNDISKYVVKCAVRAKFAQNPDLLNELLGTGDALLAECAGKDKIWGIGINLHDKSWHDVSNWRGNNQLGIILMELREEFRHEIDFRKAVQPFDFRDTEPIAVWNMKAGYLKRIPQYYNAIHAYAMQLQDDVKDCFYYEYTLNDWDIAMYTNMGGGLPIIGFYEMKQEIYEIYRRLSGKHYVSEIFAEEPQQFGTRGDPYFWRYLANCFAMTELPMDEEAFTERIHTEFYDKTGNLLTIDACSYAEELAHGGMSSGMVSGQFWLENGIPILTERLDLLNSKSI